MSVGVSSVLRGYNASPDGERSARYVHGSPAAKYDPTSAEIGSTYKKNRRYSRGTAVFVILHGESSTWGGTKFKFSAAASGSW